jgi:hypothetical protein
VSVCTWSKIMKLDFLSRLIQRVEVSSDTSRSAIQLVSPCSSQRIPRLSVFSTCRNFVSVLEDTDEMFDVMIQIMFIRPGTSM